MPSPQNMPSSPFARDGAMISLKHEESSVFTGLFLWIASFPGTLRWSRTGGRLEAVSIYPGGIVRRNRVCVSISTLQAR